MTLTESWKLFSDNDSGTIIFDWHNSFWGGRADISDNFRTVDPVFPTALRTFKSQLRGTRFQKREELKFAVRSAVAKFSVDFYKDAYNE